MKQNFSAWFLPFLFIFIVIIISGFLSCDATEPPVIVTNEDTLIIEVQSVTYSSVSLRIISTSNNDGATLELNRIEGDNEISIFLKGLRSYDTLITDNAKGSGLSINTNYGYYGVIKNAENEIIAHSDTVHVKTLKAVGQEFKWEEYSIGEPQSWFNDIWGIDENNVFISGFIRTDSMYYGVIKWNGNDFDLLTNVGGIGIYGFDDKDYWVAGASVYYFDGKKWIRIDGYSLNSQDYPKDSILYYNSTYHAIWGTSSTNLYFVGQSDNIVHWDGTKARELYGAPNINLTDIHGINENFILTTGATGVPPSVLLKFTGDKWEKVDGLDFNRLFYSCYAVSPKEFYVAGSKTYRFYNGNWTEVIGDTLGTINRIRGDKNTGEIVAVGGVNTVMHYNGIKWKNLTSGLGTARNNLSAVYITNGKIFAVGRNSSTAKLFIGTRIGE